MTEFPMSLALLLALTTKESAIWNLKISIPYVFKIVRAKTMISEQLECGIGWFHDVELLDVSCSVNLEWFLQG